MLEAEFPETFVWVYCHVGDDIYEIPETQARAQWYGVSGIPHVRIDGKFPVIGAGSCNTAYNNYRSKYMQRMSETGSMSPVEITNDYYVLSTGVGYVQATFELLDPVTLVQPVATFFLYEDNTGTYDRTVRMIAEEPVSLVNVGDQVTVVKEFAMGAWNPDNLYGVVILQEHDATKAVIQAARMELASDYALAFTSRLESVPEGNGEALFTGNLENISGVADTYDLWVESDSPWPIDFQLAGDPNWYETHTIGLGAGESADITVRMQTDGQQMVDEGQFWALSTGSGRSQPVGLRVFNGSYAVMLVDDDNGFVYDGEPTETPFETALDNLGYLYDNWDAAFAHSGATPAAGQLKDYDAVIWTTAWHNSPLTDGDVEAMKALADAGGGFYLHSRNYLRSVVGTSEFVTDYLGISDWDSHNVSGDFMTGVDGDPVSNGMLLNMEWPSPAYDYADFLTLEPGASVVFTAETGEPVTCRNTSPLSGRVVFTSVLQNGISQTDPDPNNNETVIARIMSWLLDAETSSAPEGAAALSPKLRITANPFRTETAMSFRVTDPNGSVRLMLYDVEGRRVRTLVSGRLAEGSHEVTWQGLDDRGRAVPPGVYFAILRTLGGETTTKLVRMR
ncbi:MAG: hypothetical protein GF355_15265 [Candidatus Eisenbacteria bacterium]|nr:hypothetical protein [Candidatus Eisenbacteria bacterium]